MSTQTKSSIRQEIRSLRRSLNKERQRMAASKLCEQLAELEIFSAGSRIAFYIANDGEIDPALALGLAQRQGVECYLPIVPEKGERQLSFGLVNDETEFVPNRFGIPEPYTVASALKTADELDWVLVPLVAFDTSGSRIGMGGGFYDTTLSIRGANVNGGKPAVLGLAHEIQKVETVPSDSWDIPISKIVTDVSIYRCQ